MWSERNSSQAMVYKCYQPQAICGLTDDMGRVPGKLLCLKSSASRCGSLIWTDDRPRTHLVPLPLKAEKVWHSLLSQLQLWEPDSLIYHCCWWGPLLPRSAHRGRL